MTSAIYARVSTDRQAQAQTIEQQIERLQARLKDEDQLLGTELIFRDEGYSGATLNRPGLDRLRIPVISATQSGAKLPPNPKEACHPIRTKAAPHRSPIGAQRRLG
jgi:hypothetical protein